MSTPARIEANCANARHSTGPRTGEGKARSSRNAQSHGLFAAVESLSPLEQERYGRFLEFHTGSWSPAAEEDSRLVADLALADFRRDRARAHESAWFAHRVEQLRKDENLPAPLTGEQELRLQARVLHDDCHYATVLSRLLKWERAFNRDFDRLYSRLQEIVMNRFFKIAKTNPISPDPIESSTTSDPASDGLPPAAPLPASPPRTNEPIRASLETPRNAPCPCGSGLKFKRCCGHNALPQLFFGAKAA
jgi:hypothetical protein